jgi:hypothetical protein
LTPFIISCWILQDHKIVILSQDREQILRKLREGSSVTSLNVEDLDSYDDYADEKNQNSRSNRYHRQGNGYGNGDDTVNDEKSSRGSVYSYYFLSPLKEGEEKDDLLLEKPRIRRMNKFDGNQNVEKEVLRAYHQESSIHGDDFPSENKCLRKLS